MKQDKTSKGSASDPNARPLSFHPGFRSQSTCLGTGRYLQQFHEKHRHLCIPVIFWFRYHAGPGPGPRRVG